MKECQVLTRSEMREEILDNRIEQMRQILEAILDLPVAKKALAYLDEGVGVDSPNAVWLAARNLIDDPNYVRMLKGAVNEICL